jgi:hypothetical protein
MTTYKWVATKHARHQMTVGCGFFTKSDAIKFAQREKRRHGIDYHVIKVSDIREPVRFN